MPIYEITEPGGAQRLRVAVGVNGELRQKYFTLTKNNKRVSEDAELKIWKQAEKLNTKWEKEKDEAARKRAIAAQTTKRGKSVYDTGVRGLKMVWVVKKRPNSVHYRPSFKIHVAEGHTQQGVLSVGHKKAWKQAVQKYCGIKNIHRNSHLVERMPSIQKWEELRQYYNKELGWEIPEIAIPE